MISNFTPPICAGFVIKSLRIAMAVVALVLSGLFHRANARTITTDDKVVYEVVSESGHTVRVSIENQSIHRDNASFIIIPETITDPTDGQTYTVTDIVAGAFQATAVTGVDIRAKLTAIPGNTFRNCPNLETVVFPPTLENIGGNCFMDAHKLKTPVLPEGLKVIGANAFCGTYMGSELILPSGAEIYNYAFASTSIPSIRFPEESNGFKLSPLVFRDVKELKSVVIPSWMENIPNGLFMVCPDLESVDLSQVTSGNLVVEYDAFRGDSRLTQLRLPAKMKEIGAAAFSGSGLREVKFPEMETVGAGAFNSTGIERITADCWPATPIRNFGTSMFYATPLKEITFPSWMTEIPLDCCRSCASLIKVVIPEGVEAIGNNAFHQSAVTSVTLPSTMRRIGDASFYYCTRLSSINLPEGLERIENNAFLNCALTEITIPTSIKYLGEKAFYANRLERINLPAQDDADFQPFEFGAYVFAYNPISDYTCPAWMKTVPEGFMQACQLVSLTFAPGVEEVREEAFADNTRLQVGTLPESIRIYRDRAFKACGFYLPADQYFATIYIGNDVNIASEAFRQARIKEVVFTDCRYTLGNNIFRDVTSVRRIEFPDCMTAIPDGICNGWSELTEVVWPPRLEAIGDQSFKGCEKLVFATGPDGEGNVFDFTKAPFDNLISVGDEAFANTKITDVVWPESGDNLHIGDYLFSGIETMTSAHIPAWMTSIPKGLYMNCRNLTDLLWDESDRENLEIGMDALRGLGIKTIEWPDVPTTIRENGFADNDNATWINWPESPAVMSNYTFYSCGELKGPEELPDYVTSVPAYCFSMCTSLGHFTLHDGISFVGIAAFAGCDAMKDFKTLGPVPQIQAECFKGCTSLETFSSSFPLAAINNDAFLDCRSLHTLDFHGTTAVDILGGAFSGCGSLVDFPDIIVPESKMGGYAFHNASSLTHIPVPVCGLEGDYNDWKHFMGAASLQSVNLLPLTGDNNKFYLYDDMFADAPLLGVSYYLSDIPVEKITPTGVADRSMKGILMVNRDQKYKLMENGYGALWDIREVKKPDLTLHGDIHSEFTPGSLRNHYKTMIRWEVVESDLDENAPTVYHLNRDGMEIARIEISTCELLDHVSDGNIQRNEPTNSYKIRITRDGVDYDKAEQYGDFDYEFEPGGYIMVYSNQHKNLYFHPGTSHRIGLNERMGAKSWFLFIDEFDSPDLNEPGVPDRYTYTLAMDGYDYREPVNNEGYLPGEDGLHWHYENRRLDRGESEPCVVHTAMAVPSMSVDGLYSLEDIEGDTAGVLPVSEDMMAEGISARLSYEFSDPEQIGHTLFEAPMHYPIIDHIVCYELPSRENLGVYSELQRCDIKGDKSLATGDIPVPADHDPAVGSSYQIVTSTLCRGIFGSRIVTIPGTPRLDASMEKLQLCYSYDEHNHEPVFRATVNLYPDASPMGYSEAPSDSRHSIGVWRAIDRKSVSNEMLADDGVLPDELVFHMGQDYSAHSWSCDDCSAHQKYDTTDGQWRYTDHFAIGSIPQGQLLDVNADYRVRMYVQTVDDPSRWMIAEARAVNSEVVSGVEEVRAGLSSSEPVYYNLQGMRVPQPMEGETVIVVDARGSRKMIYKRE